MGSVKEEITRLETAKKDIETAIETCGVNVPDTELIDTYASYIRQIPSAVFSGLNVDPVGGADQFIQSIKQTNGLIEATVGGLVSTSSSGLVPKADGSAGVINSPSDDYVLTYKGGTIDWYKLPANAFKNDDNNTTYTLSGTLNGNAYNVTLTPSSGSATGAKVPAMGAASSSAAGTAGLVPAPAKNKHNSFLRGDGTWVVPDNTTYSVMTGATASAAGKSGLVPQPAKGDQGKFLSGAGTWTALPSLSITDSESGNAVTDVEVSGHGITLKRGTTFSVNGHKHSSDDITALTSYIKATTVAAIASTDSLNTALGKLELKADTAYNLVKGAYDGDGTIENLAEILKVLEGISDTDTIQAIIGKYLPLAGGTMTGNVTWKAGTGLASCFPAHIYRNTYDNDGNVYDHYYKSDTSSTNSFANLRVKSGTSFKLLRFGGDGTFTWDNKSVSLAGHTHTKAQITDFAHSHDYLPLTGGVMTGALDLTNSPNSSDGYKMGVTNAGHLGGGIHFKKNGVNDWGQAITWSHGDNTSHAGIYVKSSGAYGTKMYLCTTNLFVDGAKAALEIDHTGKITALRNNFVGNLTGNASTATTATTTGDGTMTIVPQYNNEINFGGTNASSTLYVGYRATGSKPIPTAFIFGGASGSASITASKFIKSGGTSSQFLKADGSVDSNTYLTALPSHNHDYIPFEQSVNGKDMDTIKTTGFYYGYTMTNSAHTAISSFIVAKYSPDWGSQIQLCSSNQRAYVRYWQNAGGVMGTWKTLAYTSDIPTKTSQLTNDSGFLTQHQSLANYVTLNTAQTINETKTFSAQQSFTATGKAPFTVSSDVKVDNLNADFVDGYHAASLFKRLGWNSNTTYTDANTTSMPFGLMINQQDNYTSVIKNYPTGYGYLLNLSTGDESNYSGVQIYTNYNSSRTYIRSKWGSTWYDWKTLAYTSDIPTSLPANGGNSDTVDNLHATDFVKFYLSPMTSGAPADSAKSWFKDTMPAASGAIVYNVPGSEKTIIAGKSSGAYGHMLQLNYDDTYLRILRYAAGTWKSTDWEKISAGYADSAAVASYSHYANVGGGSSDTHDSVLKAYFNSKKSSIPRNSLLGMYSGAYGNGSYYMGYFLSGYDTNPYGGFFVAHYNNPYYVGISNGTYTTQAILTSTNYTNYTVQKDGTGATGTWGINITGSAGSAGSSTTCSYPAGFTSRGTNDWSGVAGTLATDWSVNGADIMFKYDGSKLNVITDGRFYQGIDIYGASKRVLDEYDISNTTWGTASIAKGLASTGYGNSNLTYYQTDGSFFGNSGWSHYIIANHGNGETYYNYTIALPFWDVPKYKRLEGGTGDGWHTFITSENISSQSVNYAASAGSAGDANTLDGYDSSAFAKIGTYNNLTHSGNEFTFASSAFSGDMWINYRTASGSLDGAITGYYFGDGKGGNLAKITSGNFSGNSNSASKLILTSCFGTTTNGNLWSTIKTGTASYLGTATVYEVYNNGGPDTYGEVLDIVSVHNSHWQPQLWFGSGKAGRLRYRNKDYNDNSWGDWKTVAWTSEIPSVGNGTVTINQAGASKGSFTLNQSAAATINLTDTNYYPTAFSWTGGTTSGPTGSLTGTGMTAVSFGAIPSASASASGIVTTAAQSFAGVKTFTGKVELIGGGSGSMSITYDKAALVIGTMSRAGSTDEYYPGIAFNHMYGYAGGSGYRNHAHAWIGLRLESTPGSELSSLIFATQSSTTTGTALTERMCITPEGTVGIGAISPNTAYKLYVNGHIYGSKLYSPYIQDIHTNYLPFLVGRVYKGPGGTYAYTDNGMTGLTISQSRNRAGRYIMTITNNTGKYVYIHTPIVTPVFGDWGGGSCYESPFAYLDNNYSYAFPVSVADGKTMQFTVICGKIHTQGSWSSGDFTKSNDDGGFSVCVYASWAS